MIITRMTIATLALFATAALSAAQAPQAPAPPSTPSRPAQPPTQNPSRHRLRSRHDSCADHGHAGRLSLSRESGTWTDANGGRTSWCAGRLHIGGCGDAGANAAGDALRGRWHVRNSAVNRQYDKVENIPDERLKALVGKRVEVSGRIDPEDAGLGGGPTQDRGPGPDKVNLPEFEAGVDS